MATQPQETLADQVSRLKHRWLKRVMSDPKVSPTQKCFAYIVMDRLNCVTLDAWPGQPLIAQDLGRKCIKTAHRVAEGLEAHGYLHVTRDSRGSYRYSPIFLPTDADTGGSVLRQTCPSVPDKSVDESSLRILPNLSSPREHSKSGIAFSFPHQSNYDHRQRGAHEVAVAKRLGNDGFDVLMRLSELDETIVDRLCRAHSNGELGERELIATRLAAGQMRRKRRPT